MHRLIKLLAVSLALCACAQAEPFPPPMDMTAKENLPAGYKLVFSDEFDGAALDRSKWYPAHVTRDEGNDTNFQDDPRTLWVGDGKLHLALRKAWTGPAPYAGALIDTQTTFTFRYGRFAARIKMPKDAGVVPSFWMAHEIPGSEPFPHQGEIDVVEALSAEKVTVLSAIHYFYRGHVIKSNIWSHDRPLSEDFHIYSVDWTPDAITWYFDGRRIHRVEDWGPGLPGRPSAPFDLPFFLILSAYTDRDFGKLPPKTTPLPQVMEVDWVRVYQGPGQATYDLRKSAGSRRQITPPAERKQ